MLTPQSSHIQSINYNPKTRTLRATFKRKPGSGTAVVYIYRDVEQSIWDQLSDENSSVGHAFHVLIKKPALRFTKHEWAINRDTSGRFCTTPKPADAYVSAPPEPSPTEAPSTEELVIPRGFSVDMWTNLVVGDPSLAEALVQLELVRRGEELLETIGAAQVADHSGLAVQA
jgi:hypothetical protein